MEVLFILFSDEKKQPLRIANLMYFMYTESVCSPICYGQSVLTKESPTAVNYILHTKERNVFYDKHVQMKVVIIS